MVISGVRFMLGMMHGSSLVQWSQIGFSMAEERVLSISLTLRKSSCSSVSSSGSSSGCGSSGSSGSSSPLGSPSPHQAADSSSFFGSWRGCVKVEKGFSWPPPACPSPAPAPAPVPWRWDRGTAPWPLCLQILRRVGLALVLMFLIWSLCNDDVTIPILISYELLWFLVLTNSGTPSGKKFGVFCGFISGSFYWYLWLHSLTKFATPFWMYSMNPFHAFLPIWSVFPKCRDWHIHWMAYEKSFTDFLILISSLYPQASATWINRYNL